jgi:phosphate transport system protein
MAITETGDRVDLIEEIDMLVLHLFARVSDGITRATTAFLDHDKVAAQGVIAAEVEFDKLSDEVERLLEEALADPRCAEHLPYLLSVVRIVPELERSGDLVEHIALRTAHGLLSQITRRTRGYLAAMGDVGAEMWRTATDAFADRDPAVAAALRRRDDDLDDLHVRLTAELAEGSLPPAAAIEMGLLGRFYERLGDHAVNVTRRLRLLPEPVVSS